MVTNSDIIPTSKSDTAFSKDIDKSPNEIKPINSTSDSVIGANKLSFNKILVTYDGTHDSDKAVDYSIYLSNISKAEIVILQVIGNLDNLENSSMNLSNKRTNMGSKVNSSISSSNESKVRNGTYTIKIEGSFIKSMEDKIKEIETTGFGNKISYKIRPGFVPDEIVKEIKESKYDLLIISSSHMDSWINSLFSKARKIISHVDLPVLLLQ